MTVEITIDRTKFSQWLRKKFAIAIPRDILKISLFLSVAVNLALAFWVLLLWGQSVGANYESERIAFSAGYELAKTDVRHGQPRYLRLNVVDSNARASYEFEETQETYEGLPVWEWRWADPYHREPRLTNPQHLLNTYNGLVYSLLKRDSLAK